MIFVHLQQFALNAVLVFTLMERMAALRAALDVWYVQPHQYAINAYRY